MRNKSKKTLKSEAYFFACNSDGCFDYWYNRLISDSRYKWYSREFN